MICAYFDLIGSKDYISEEDKNGIILLDEGEIGSKDWIKIIGLDDTIYDITLPVNRNDENSYLVFCFLANKSNLELSFDINNLAKWTSNVTNDMNIDYSICNFLCYLDYDSNKNFIDHSPFSLKSMLIIKLNQLIICLIN